MKKRLITDFYREERYGDSENEFSSILDIIINKKVKERNIDYGDSIVRLQDCKRDQDGIYEGNLVKIRMVALPSKAHIDGDLTEFDLSENEGMGEETAFLFDSNLKILAFQRNRYSVSLSLFLFYFKKILNLKSEFDFLPILTKDSLNKFQKMNSINKFNIKVAGISNPENFKNSGYTPEKVIDLLNEFEAPHMELTFSMGFSRGSLKINAIQNAVNQLLKFAKVHKNGKREEITSLVVTGSDSEGSSEIIDLIANRLFESKELDLSRKQRLLPYESRKIIIKDHYQLNSDELKERFKS